MAPRRLLPGVAVSDIPDVPPADFGQEISSEDSDRAGGNGGADLCVGAFTVPVFQARQRAPIGTADASFCGIPAFTVTVPPRFYHVQTVTGEIITCYFPDESGCVAAPVTSMNFTTQGSASISPVSCAVINTQELLSSTCLPADCIGGIKSVSVDAYPLPLDFSAAEIDGFIGFAAPVTEIVSSEILTEFSSNPPEACTPVLSPVYIVCPSFPLGAYQVSSSGTITKRLFDLDTAALAISRFQTANPFGAWQTIPADGTAETLAATEYETPTAASFAYDEAEVRLTLAGLAPFGNYCASFDVYRRAYGAATWTLFFTDFFTALTNGAGLFQGSAPVFTDVGFEFYADNPKVFGVP